MGEFIELFGNSGRPILIRKSKVESVYYDSGDLMIDLGGFDGNRFIVPDRYTYERIKEMLLEGDNEL